MGLLSVQQQCSKVQGVFACVHDRWFLRPIVATTALSNTDEVDSLPVLGMMGLGLSVPLKQDEGTERRLLSDTRSHVASASESPAHRC